MRAVSFKRMLGSRLPWLRQDRIRPKAKTPSLYDAVGPAEEFEVRSVVVTETQEGLGSGPTIQHPHVGAAPFIGNQRDALAIAIITGMGRRIESHLEPPIRLEPEPKALVPGRVVDGKSDRGRDALPL